MAPSSDEVDALAEELAALAKGSAAAEADPMAKKHQTHAVVMKAKSLVNKMQDPVEALEGHVTNVRPCPPFPAYQPIRRSSEYLLPPVGEPLHLQTEEVQRRL